MAQTLRQYLDNKRWKYFESGMIPEWNDLDRIADATGQNLAAVAVSTLDLTAIGVAPLPTSDAGRISTITGGVAIQKTPPAAQFR